MLPTFETSSKVLNSLAVPENVKEKETVFVVVTQYTWSTMLGNGRNGQLSF